MPSLPPRSPFDAIAHEHAHFEPSLAAAAAAAKRLAGDRRNRRALDQARSAWRFIRVHALPHMRYEEAVLFPRAMERGAPEELIGLLTEEHEALRGLAEALRPLDGTPDAAEVPEGVAVALSRFVERFDAHLAKEEDLLATLARAGALG